jgi:hypothetical protein
MNVVLDTYTDVPMLLRWTIAIGVGLLITICLSHWFKKRRGQDERSRTTGRPSTNSSPGEFGQS